LCRDPEYCTLNIQFTIEVFKRAMFINLFPYFLRPIVGRLISDVSKNVDQAVRHLEDTISERLRNLEEYKGNWSDKPNDLLQWLIDEAPDDSERTIRALSLRILNVNNAAIHTSSLTFRNALYYLATYPQYIQPLREEIESIVQEDGWTKTAMGKMYKLDSFIKETQRLTGLGVGSMGRTAASDYVFSDGTLIPKGTALFVPMRAIHRDETIYPNPSAFEPFRFADLREDGETGKGQYGMVSTSVEWLPFGHGRHACPGRFFASNEIKAMFAHLVLEYDVKTGNEGIMPSLTDRNVELHFRKRHLEEKVAV